MIASLLRMSGYRVDTAGDSGAGLIQVCFNSYDLLITEHDMPNLTGLDLLRRIRACPLYLPAIMISGFIPWEESDLDCVLRPGAVLEKPFSFGSLLTKVHEFLHGNQDGSPFAREEPQDQPRSFWRSASSQPPPPRPWQGARLPGLV